MATKVQAAFPSRGHGEMFFRCQRGMGVFISDNLQLMPVLESFLIKESLLALRFNCQCQMVETERHAHVGLSSIIQNFNGLILQLNPMLSAWFSQSSTSVKCFSFVGFIWFTLSLLTRADLSLRWSQDVWAKARSCRTTSVLLQQVTPCRKSLLESHHKALKQT